MKLERVNGVPPGTFPGKNFMTQDIRGHYRATIGGAVAYLEVSKETPPYWQATVEQLPDPQPLIGLTFRRPGGAFLDPDPSTCVYGLRAAEEHLGLPEGSLS